MLTLTLRLRHLTWMVAFVVVLSVVWVGQDRARAGVAPPGDGIDLVYVTTGNNFPDALGVGPGAGLGSAPIIIVPTNPPLPAVTSAELVRLDPKRVVIVGGTAVVSASMETAIASLLPNTVMERIAGANRYETNALFSQETFPVEGWASIPAAAFTAPNPDVHDAFMGLAVALNSTNGALWAPIQLPHGAEILELRVSGADADAGQDLTATLWRVSNTDATLTVASVSSAGQPGNFTVSTTTITPDAGVVDNAIFGYAIQVQGADGNPFLRNGMVRYRLGNPGT